jgi:hypothetical protein
LQKTVGTQYANQLVLSLIVILTPISGQGKNKRTIGWEKDVHTFPRLLFVA